MRLNDVKWMVAVRPERTRVIGWAGVAFALLLAGCQRGADGASADAAPAAEAAGAEFADDGAKAAYSLGYMFTENVTRQFGTDLDVDSFVRGVRDRLAGTDAVVDDAEAQRVLSAFMEQRQAAALAEASSNLDKGLEFLAANSARDGVITLDSGLQYEVLTAGEGASPGAADVVTTHYEGRLIDGTVFDSSIARGEPMTFSLDRVIPGWTEGLQLMAPGAKYRLYVPATLAYGDRAAGSVPANSTLIFDVELISVGTPPAAEAPAADSPAAEAPAAEAPAAEAPAAEAPAADKPAAAD